MSWPRKTSYFWQEAPFFRPVLLLALGILAFDRKWLPIHINMIMIAVLAGAGILAACFAVIRRRTVIIDWAYNIAAALFFVTLGWTSYALMMPAGLTGTDAPITDSTSLTLVQVKEARIGAKGNSRLSVEMLALVSKGSAKAIAGKALLYVYSGGDAFTEHDSLLVPTKWSPVHNPGNPFEFDFAKAQRRKGIFWQESLSASEVTIYGKASPASIGFVKSIHNWCDRQLKAYVSDSAALGLLRAMLLGDESGFDPELRQAYSQTGVIHIVSISGSHVSMLYLVVLGMLFWAKGRRGTIARFVLGIVLVWLYVLIAGAPPSAMRAAITFSILTFCSIINREGNAINTICCAAFILLAYQPEWLFSVGFQLSFGAVLSIVIFYRPLYRFWYWPTQTWAGRLLWQAAAASIAAEILTAPLVIYYFHNFPLLFLFANLLAALLAGMCALVGGMAIIAFCWLPPLAYALGWMVSMLVNVFNRAIVWMQGLNLPTLQHLQISFVETLLVYATITGLGVWRLNKRRYGLSFALMSASLLFIMMSVDNIRAMRQIRLIAYNSGKTPSVEIISGKKFRSLTNSPEGYNEQSAHIGYHAWHKDAAPASPYCLIGNRRMLVLSDSTRQSFSGMLPVDVLILARPLYGMQIGNVISTFKPKEVVIATRASAYHAQRWSDSCGAHNIKLHNVGVQGAYVSE